MHRTILIASFLVSLALAPAAAGAQEPELYDYVVKKGDTCVRIAKRELGSRKAYKLIHKHNPNMGKTPHRLKRGSILKLPKKNSKPDAHITDKQGSVRYRKPAAEDWSAAKKGTPLFRSWRVNSQKKSSAELTFADKSSIRLRENTVVIVYGPSNTRARKRAAYASLERGTLRARLGDFDGKSRAVVVDTPGSEAEISNGSALISVDESGTSRVANHEGKSVVVRSKGKRSKKVRVAVGMGSKVKRGLAPEKPKPLPPTPKWQPGPRNGAAFAKTGGTLRGKWAAVKEAKSYRVEIAIDPVARVVVASVVVPNTITEFEAAGLPPGKYFTSVSAIDSDKFESIPSPREAMTLAELTVEGDVVGTIGGPLKALAGSTVTMPDGVKCGHEGNEPTQVLALRAGAELRCTENGKDISTPPITVVSLDAKLASAQSLSIEKPSLIEIQLAADGLAIPALSVRSEQLEVTNTEQKGDRLLVTARGIASANNQGTLEVINPNGVLVATLSFTTVAKVKPAAKPIPKPIATPVPQWEIGAFSELGVGTRDFGRELGAEPFASVGLRLGRRLGARLFVELEGAYGQATLSQEQSVADVIGARGWLGATLLSSSEASLFVIAGPSLVIVSDERTTTDLGGSYGAGVKLGVTSRLLLRLEGRHLIVPARGQDGVASELETQLGLSWLF